jgi:hypothetical protein
VSSWATLLLVIYVSLGLSRVSQGKAVRVAVVLTTLVVSFEMIRMMRGGG